MRAYFTELRRNKGESMSKYIAREANAYRKLQHLMNKAMETGDDVWSDDEGTPSGVGKSIKFKLPRHLRGWLFLQRAGLKQSDLPGILQQTRGTDIEKLRQLLQEAYPDGTLPHKDSEQPSNSRHRAYVAQEDETWWYDEGNYYEEEEEEIEEEHDQDAENFTSVNLSEPFVTEDGYY
eukprot:3769559-Amphidinium_carterae.1